MHKTIITGVVFLLSFLFSHVYAEQHSDALENLLKPFQTINHIKLSYHEKRSSLFLKQPKTLSGYIEYSRPDRFIKTIEPSSISPIQKKFIIEAEQLLIEQFNTVTAEKSSKNLSLGEFPQLKQFKALFTGLLQGKAEVLTQFYRYKIKIDDNEHTQLILKPHINDAFIQKQQNISQQINILFEDDSITSISMLGFGGERSTLIIDTIFQRDSVQ